MIKRCVYFFLLLLPCLLHAQVVDSVKITGQVLPDSGYIYKPDKSELRLVPYMENESARTSIVGSNGTFTLTVPVTATGYYDLKYKSYKLGLLLTPKEPLYKVIIKTDAQQEVKAMKITGSRENDAYRIFKRENIAFRDLLRDLKTDCSVDKAACLIKYKKQVSAQNDLMAYLKLAYKGTYTADVLANLGSMPELNSNTPPLDQIQNTFFDIANLADTNLYRTPDLNNRISWYLDYVAKTTVAGRVDFISGLMNKVHSHSDAKKLLLTFLFNNFLDEYREPYVASLVQWSATQPNLAADAPLAAAKIKLVANVLPGLLAPDVTGENTERKTETLLSTTKSNKLTLLIFWESDCPHCRKAMPGFISLYKQYHTKGLEVFAASLDSDKNKWKSYIQTNHLNWVNIVLPENSTAHSDYFIQYTPTAVLIDAQGKIVHRFISVEDIAGAVVAYLK